MDDIDYSFEKWFEERGHQEPDPLIEKWMGAASRGDTAAVIEFLNSEMDINARARRGETALFTAVWSGNLDTMRVLLERGANLNYVNSYRYTVLTHAIRRSQPKWWDTCYVPDPEPLRLLVAAGARFNLIDAFWINDLELARLRLEEGANPDHGEWTYHGPVLMEAAQAGNLAMIDLLLDFGANIEVEDDLGNRPLLRAADRGQIEAVRRILERGAELDARNWSGVSALAYAAVGDHNAIVELLLSRGARRGIVDALALDDLTIFDVLLDEELRKERDIDWISDGRFRLAMVAAARGNPRMVCRLLDRGAVLLLDRDQHSLLAEAARHGHLEVIRLLIDRGASLEAVGRDGLTPLAWAIREGQEEAASLLRRAGASEPS